MTCVSGTRNHRAERCRTESMQRGLGVSTTGLMHDLQSRLWARVTGRVMHDLQSRLWDRVTGRVMQGQGGTAVRTVHGVRS
jgi:hypothetical protein